MAASTLTQDDTDRLAAVEARLGDVEAALELLAGHTAHLVQTEARVDAILSKLEPIVDDLRPMIEQLMAGKVGRIVRVLSKGGE